MNGVLRDKYGRDLPLAMQRLEMAGHITPAGALLRVTHHMACADTANMEAMEALYTFMLPRNGVLRRFVVKGEDFEVESKLEARQEARKQYEEGVAKGHLSVLSEINPDGMVTLSAGMVRPGEPITIVMDIVSGVELRDGIYQFRFPFTIAPAYHRAAKCGIGNRMEFPKDIFEDIILPKWTTKREGLHEVTFSLKAETMGELKSVSSPSHRIKVDLIDKDSVEVSLEAGADVPNRDLVIEVASKTMPSVVWFDENVVEGAPRWNLVIPSKDIPHQAKSPKKICFVLDNSGSMSGQPLDAAKRALQLCLSALGPDDMFGLLNFNSTPTKFHDALLPATDKNRNRAMKFLESLYATGGTELLSAMGVAMDILDNSGGDILLITDGEVADTARIISQCVVTGTHIHALGIGSASQDRFLANLATQSGGIARMVGVNDDIRTRTLELFNSIRTPIQSNMEVYIKTGPKAAQKHMVDVVWDGIPVILSDDGTTDIQKPESVSLLVDGKKVKFPVGYLELPKGSLGLLWAARKIGLLEIELDSTEKGSPVYKTKERELSDLSLQYGLASRVVSLVAIVKQPGDTPGDMRQTVASAGFPEGMAQSSHTITRSFHDRTGYNAALLRGMGQVSNNTSYTNTVGSSYDFLDMEMGSSNGGNDYQIPRCTGHIRTKSCEGRGMSALNAFISVCDTIGTSTGTSINTSADILDYLAVLQADGGYPGHNLEMRILRTALLVIIATWTNQSLYSAHIDRMATFLKVYSGESEPVQRALEIKDSFEVLDECEWEDWADSFDSPDNLMTFIMSL